jgi:hypothetical protein
VFVFSLSDSFLGDGRLHNYISQGNVYYKHYLGIYSYTVCHHQEKSQRERKNKHLINITLGYIVIQLTLFLVMADCIIIYHRVMFIKCLFFLSLTLFLVMADCISIYHRVMFIKCLYSLPSSPRKESEREKTNT